MGKQRPTSSLRGTLGTCTPTCAAGRGCGKRRPPGSSSRLSLPSPTATSQPLCWVRLTRPVSGPAFQHTQVLLPSWAVVAIPPGSHAGFARPKFHKTLAAPQVWREMTGSVINRFAMQEMTAVDNCSPLYNLQTVVFVFSP